MTYSGNNSFRKELRRAPEDGLRVSRHQDARGRARDGVCGKVRVEDDAEPRIGQSVDHGEHGRLVPEVEAAFGLVGLGNADKATLTLVIGAWKC